MKKIIFFLSLMIPIKVFSLSAASAIAMDLETGRVLYGYNIDEKRLIASTTKIMTAIAAIENSDINREIVVSDIIHKAYGSAIYIEVGEKITIKDLLYGLMLRSGNDAALVISQEVSGSEEEFVYLMNEYANNLKLNKTKFYNPHGLEEDNGLANTSSAYDMAKLTKYAMQNPTFREIFKTKKYVLKTNYKTYIWHNKNKLLKKDYITGGKTGWTKLAKRTLVTTGSKNNINVVVVTLNDSNDWEDHKTIYNKIFNDYKSYKILDKNNYEIKEDTFYNNNNLYIKNDFYMTLKKEELNNISINYNLYKMDDYVDDDIVGWTEIKLNDYIYHKEPIYVKKSIKKKKNTINKLKEWLQKW